MHRKVLHILPIDPLLHSVDTTHHHCSGPKPEVNSGTTHPAYSAFTSLHTTHVWMCVCACVQSHICSLAQLPSQSRDSTITVTRLLCFYPFTATPIFFPHQKLGFILWLLFWIMCRPAVVRLFTSELQALESNLCRNKGNLTATDRWLKKTTRLKWVI